jgi:hypothetical protein
LATAGTISTGTKLVLNLALTAEQVGLFAGANGIDNFAISILNFTQNAVETFLKTVADPITFAVRVLVLAATRALAWFALPAA